MLEFLDGAELIARGAIDIGCNFFAGYPITPASSILTHMLRALPAVGGTGIQAEDEIAAISMAIGAAMTGARAMSATSGPGISLFSENIGLALMGEVPLVIVDVQRLGPATGGATTVAQGDVQFLRWSTSGGYPVIVLCPSDAPECYAFTQQCFNLAERFRAPVFLATDKETVLTQTRIDTDRDLARLEPVRREYATGSPQAFLPYAAPEPDTVPAFAALGDPERIVRFTTSTHDERGILTKKPAAVGKLNERLFQKIQAHAADLEMARYDPQDGARTLLVAFGITARAMQEAAAEARAAGERVSTLTVQSLFPVPERILRRALGAHRRIVVAELNHGQYRLEIERIAHALDPRPEVVGVHRVDGELITPEQMRAAVEQ